MKKFTIFFIALAFMLLSTQSVSAATEPLAPTVGTQAVRQWFNDAFATTEAFRVKEAAYFAGLRDEKRETLGIDTVRTYDDNSDVGAGGTEAPHPMQETVLTSPIQYFVYIFSISLATLCASVPLFYITSALLLLIILRFIVSRLV